MLAQFGLGSLRGLSVCHDFSVSVTDGRMVFGLPSVAYLKMRHFARVTVLHRLDGVYRCDRRAREAHHPADIGCETCHDLLDKDF